MNADVKGVKEGGGVNLIDEGVPEISSLGFLLLVKAGIQ